MFEAVGRFAYRRKWWVIAVWLTLALAGLPAVVQVADVLKVGGFSNDKLEASQARAVLERELGFPPVALVVNFHSDTLTADSPEFIAQVRTALAEIEKAPQVTGTTYHMLVPSQVSEDRHTAYEVIGLSVPPEESQNFLPEVERLLQPTSLQTLIGGAPAFYADIERTSQTDLQRAELIAFPFALAALLLVFGSAVAAGVPLVIGGFGVVLVLALLSVVGRATDLSIFAMNVATMLGLGLAVDYSLFIVSRFREELQSHTVEEAVVATIATAGKAVFFSGLTVLIGLVGLITFEFMFLRSVGIAGVIVVFVSVLVALTLLPAILGVLGRRIERFAVRLPLRSRRQFWAPLASWVMRRPVRVLVPTLAILVLFGLPFLNVRLSSPDPSILPAGMSSREAFDQLKQEFTAGALAPIQVVFKSDGPITAPENLATMRRLSEAVRREKGVLRVESIVNVDPRLTLEQYELMYLNPEDVPDGFGRAILDATTTEHVALMQVYSEYLWNDPESQLIVERLRATKLPAGIELQVGGATAEVQDVVNEMYAEFPRALLFVVVATYFALALMLRSVLLPLKAIVMNTLSILASYGALVWIFQEGNLSWLFRFEPLGFVESSLPILMFCILFGLSMDYEVFLLSRIKEEWERTGDNTASVAAGLERSGRIITSAAVIVVVVGLAFVTAEIILIKTLGLGIAIAVLLDATLVRALLVPATMRLLGDWNWWAPSLRRRYRPKVKYGD
ncbi:MAG: MMPL family transporter [Chloroflexia bacterium]